MDDLVPIAGKNLKVRSYTVAINRIGPEVMFVHVCDAVLQGERPIVLAALLLVEDVFLGLAEGSFEDEFPGIHNENGHDLLSIGRLWLVVNLDRSEHSGARVVREFLVRDVRPSH